MAENKEIVWSGIQVASIKGASFVFSILMARLVAPEAYGLIAMISVFIAFFQLFVDSGLGNALIQKHDKSDIDYNTTFSSNLLISILVYIIMYIAAPYVAKFYNEQQLTIIVRWSSLSLIIQGLYLVQKCRLVILIDFKTQALTGVISTIISGIIGLSLAYFGFGVWALVFQSLSGQLINAILMVYYSNWVPRIQFSKKSFISLFNFGSKDFIGNILTSFFMNISNLLIGKFYSPSSLAYYNRGFNLGFMPAGMIQETVCRISYPIQCKFQKDRDNLLSSYYKYIGLAAFISFPIMTLLAVLAKPIIIIILTQRWIQAVPYTQIMALAYLTYPIHVCIIQIVNAVGKPGLNMKYGIVKRIIAFIILLFSVSISVKAVAWGLLISNIIELLLSACISAKVLNIPFFDQFKPVLKSFFVCLLIAIVSCIICKYMGNYYLQIILSLFSSSVIYIGMSYLLKIKERVIFDKIASIFRKIYDKKI